MNKLHSRLYRLISTLVCVAILLTPAFNALAQESAVNTIYLPLIQNANPGTAAEPALDAGATPALPPVDAEPPASDNTGEITLLQGDYPPPPVDATPRDENGMPLTPAEAEMTVSAAAVSSVPPIDMVAGRLTKTPAGVLHKWEWFFTTKFRVRVICVSEPCDTGLLVVVNGRAWYNDNDPETLGKGSYVCVTCDDPSLQNMRAEIYIFSQQRTWSQASVHIDSGSGWVEAAQRRFGGTLVKVGPLHSGDYVKVQADRQSNSNLPFDNNDTHMVLFNPSRPMNGALYHNNISTSDWNPEIKIQNQNWLHGDNYVLLGKINVSANSNLGVEARVDLVRGPLNRDKQDAAFPQNSGAGAPLWLKPGRYYAWLYAMTNSPVGYGQINPANQMPSDKCEDALIGFENPSDPSTAKFMTFYRGQLNAKAFMLFVQRGRVRNDGSLGWVDVGSGRLIPLSALGMAPGGRNLFLAEIKVDEAAWYRLEAFRPYGAHPDVSFFNRWFVHRNPDASEIKVVSYNTFYEDGNQAERTRNAANLLATRGSVNRTDLYVSERADQTPWQWEADIIGLQELEKLYPPHDPQTPLPDWAAFGLADIFAEEAEQQGPLQWSYVKGRDEDFEFGESGLGPLFVGENVWPSHSETGVYFSNAAKQHAQCTYDGRLDFAECHVDDAASGLTDAKAANNYATPAKAAVRRYGSSHDRPIAAFNLHLEFESDSAVTLDSTKYHRWTELDSLIKKIDKLLSADPDAFNAPADANNRTDPLYWQNRFIIMGDINMNAHTCGEHYWILQKLRQHYGYAVDASMYLLDANGNHFGAHDKMGDLSNWQSINDWRNAPDMSQNSRFPWWSSTYRGATGDVNRKSERYDAIFLVGKGWSSDDPLLEYKVMSDRENPSPMYPNGGGVEMWMGNAGIVANSGTNYYPNWDLDYGRGPGTPALHTDHQPLMARIRIYTH